MAEWIKVSERLPNRPKVIIYTKNGVSMLDLSVTNFCWEVAIKILGITHWMPTPTPPEAEK